MASFPPPVLLRETDSAQGILTCTLCHELAMEEPVMTPCNHVFCRSCISQALEHKNECPNDRKELHLHQLHSLSGISRRIWEQVGVRCPNQGCAWTGTAGNYSNHVAICGQRSQLSVEKEREYKSRIEQLELQNIKLQETIYNLSNTCQSPNTTSPDQITIQELKDKIRALRFQLGVEQGERRQLVEAQRVRLATAEEEGAVQFDNSYNYGREGVVELAQLICKYLENKPSVINPSRIYNCVRNCYQDFQRGYTDNPANYSTDVRMLLHICLASTWFTTKQRENIMTWCREHAWLG
jgi:Zinc finger, C3HC4 type (RING finger)